ncbi:MAG: lactonase family protein [Chloroflexi bacterium]|nr:lactonase family protein [Chloroflexota bacterium]MDA1270731.1 lactonase family protein [Chloroflexota bacterium]
MAYYMYLSIQEEDRIAIFSMTPKTGKLKHLGDAELKGRPAPMAMDPDRKYLFAGRRKADEYGLSSFNIDPKNGGLSPIGSIPLQGDPVHISTDRTGRFLLSAYYYQKSVGVHRIGDDGALADPPVVWRETDIGAHYIQTDPTNRYAYVPHIANGSMKGANAIFQFKFNEKTGRLTPLSPTRTNNREMEGPRHLCFHPTKDLVYASNEQGSSVTLYTLDPDKGNLHPAQTVSTLPSGYHGENSCSQIQITPNGKFLYAPNRGHNSIAGFRVNPNNGHIAPIGQTPTEAVPRAFTIDPQGSFLYAAGLGTGKLASYRIKEDGVLEAGDVYDVGKGPMWVMIAEL